MNYGNLQLNHTNIGFEAMLNIIDQNIDLTSDTDADSYSNHNLDSLFSENYNNSQSTTNNNQASMSHPDAITNNSMLVNDKGFHNAPIITIDTQNQALIQNMVSNQTNRLVSHPFTGKNKTKRKKKYEKKITKQCGKSIMRKIIASRRNQANNQQVSVPKFINPLNCVKILNWVFPIT